MIEDFELKEEFRKIKPFKVAFQKGLNIVVGENGSGKSTLLELLMKKNQVSVTHGNGTYHFLDTEKQNPRLKNPNGMGKLFDFGVLSRFSSHGEAMLPLIETIKGFSEKIIIIDEPESGISLSNQKKVIGCIKKAAKDNQVILTTHSYVIIKNMDIVFSMDVKKWITQKEYFEKIKL